MKVSKIVLAGVLALSAASAMAGEVVNSGVSAIGVFNPSAGLNSTALQNIGVAEQNGHIGNTAVVVNGAVNTSAGAFSNATQNIGHASGNGRIDRSFVMANGA